MNANEAKKIIRDAALADGSDLRGSLTDALDQWADDDADVAKAISVLSYKDAYDVFSAARRVRFGR